MTAEEYLNHPIEVANTTASGVQAGHLVLLRKLITEGKTGVYVP